MKVGDLVQYRYRNQDIGIIIEAKQETNEPYPKAQGDVVGYSQPYRLDATHRIGANQCKSVI